MISGLNPLIPNCLYKTLKGTVIWHDETGLTWNVNNRTNKNLIVGQGTIFLVLACQQEQGIYKILLNDKVMYLSMPLTLNDSFLERID